MALQITKSAPTKSKSTAVDLLRDEKTPRSTHEIKKVREPYISSSRQESIKKRGTPNGTNVRNGVTELEELLDRRN